VTKRNEKTSKSHDNVKEKKESKSRETLKMTESEKIEKREVRQGG
jgi:hypothetical protein